MKIFILCLGLGVASANVPPPELAVMVEYGFNGGGTAALQGYLDAGYTVKHQPVTIGETAHRVLVILTPPSPQLAEEIRKRADAARQAAWEKKRAEHAAKSAQNVEKPR